MKNNSQPELRVIGTLPDQDKAEPFLRTIASGSIDEIQTWVEKDPRLAVDALNKRLITAGEFAMVCLLRAILDKSPQPS